MPLLTGCASVMIGSHLDGGWHQRAADKTAEQNRKPPARRSRQLRPGHDRCGMCLLHGAPPPNEPNRATPLGPAWVDLSQEVAVQTLLRGWLENLIKLHKRQLASDRTSCRSALANQVRLVLHTAAYWLMLTVRDAIPRPQPLATAEFTTLRLRLLKIAARVTETATRVRIAFAAACPEAELFRGVARRLQLAGP